MTALVAVLALPILGALAAVALPRRAGGAAALATVGLGTAAAAALVVAVATGGVQRIEAGGWAPPLGIALAADGLAAALVAMGAAVIAAAAAIAARTDLAGPDAPARTAFGFWPLMLLVWAGLNAVVVSRDLFNIYVGLEVLGLAAVGLAALPGTPAALAAALRYLMVALTGALLFLAGVVLVYAAHGTLDIWLLAGRTAARSDAAALALMTAGLAAKTALFPFHVWLPPAHAQAPAPASALLSGLVPKASFVVILRLWFEAMPDRATPAALVLLAVAGAAAVLWGGLRALAQARLKPLVAYSTVAQLGYLFLVFPLAGGDGAAQPWAAGAWTGAAFILIGHGLAKAAMFLTAGLWLAAAGSDRLADLRGLARAMPISALAFALAAVTLAGLPPSAGFTGKYLLMTAAFAGGQWIWAVVLAGGGLLTAAYLYRPLAVIFARSAPRPPRPVARSLQAVPLLLALVAIGLGIASAAPFDLVQVGRPATAEEGL